MNSSRIPYSVVFSMKERCFKPMLRKSILPISIILLFFTQTLKAKQSEILLNDRDQKVRVTIYYPESVIRGNLLLLHGWNLPPVQWLSETNILSLALEVGFVVITPDFGKTTYHWELYPQTIEKYRPYPTRQWMDTIFFPELQKLKILVPGMNNFVAGLSTGGRGAALFALEHPEIFKAAACLSADFDQSQIPDEPINTGFYGAYNKFPKRWKGKDNIYNRASEMKTPLYLAHGKADKICPWNQTASFSEKLKNDNPELEVITLIDSLGGHNYTFWESHSQGMIDFFVQKLQ